MVDHGFLLVALVAIALALAVCYLVVVAGLLRYAWKTHKRTQARLELLRKANAKDFRYDPKQFRR